MIDYFYKIISEECFEGKFSTRIELVLDNPIFQAHFPGNPITPGACQVEILREAVSRAAGKNLRIAAIRNLKFLNIIDPLRTPSFTIAGGMKDVDGVFQCTATVSEGETLFTKISLLLKQ